MYETKIKVEGMKNNYEKITRKTVSGGNPAACRDVSDVTLHMHP